ncbi:MAG: hypothetical protein ACYTGQ_11210 [Planctomycetota bacterium]
MKRWIETRLSEPRRSMAAMSRALGVASARASIASEACLRAWVCRAHQAVMAADAAHCSAFLTSWSQAARARISSAGVVSCSKRSRRSPPLPPEGLSC